jgi:hypothetical protein
VHSRLEAPGIVPGRWEIKIPALSLQKAQRQGRGTRSSIDASAGHHGPVHERQRDRRDQYQGLAKVHARH